VAKVKTSAPTSVAVRPLVTQSHGGALLPGGPGAGGRPKEVLRRRCREEIETRKGFEFVGRVLDGTETQDVPVTVGSGKEARTEVVRVRPKIWDRLLAFELLADRGWGKPDQAVQIEEDVPRRSDEEVAARLLELLPRDLANLPVDREELGRVLAERRRIAALMQGEEVRDGPSGNGDGAGRPGAVR
jgi:hypothetical protein